VSTEDRPTPSHGGAAVAAVVVVRVVLVVVVVAAVMVTPHQAVGATVAFQRHANTSLEGPMSPVSRYTLHMPAWLRTLHFADMRATPSRCRTRHEKIHSR
jgi:hypothetical protein